MTEIRSMAFEDMRPAEIATFAKAQLAGGFSTQSDAMTALNLIVALCARLEEVSAYSSAA